MVLFDCMEALAKASKEMFETIPGSKIEKTFKCQGKDSEF